MDTGAPAFLLREAKLSDQRQLTALARELDSINLPTDSARMGEAIECSARAFRGQVRNRARAVYLFCAEDLATGRIVAASMIIGKHGTPAAPHYYLELDADDRYSHTLRKMFRHPYLRLRHSMDGPTELGGLIVTPAMRGHPERVGKQISWVRFLYIGKHLKRFEPRMLAEMLAPMLPGHGNLFWDHYGRKITGMSFREADILSTRDKEFIPALFPDAPLYTFLLPDEVRQAIGVVSEHARGAVRLLEQAGMRYLNHIDPFDGGPYYGAATAELAPVKNLRATTIVEGEPPAEKRRAYLIAIDNGEGFRAVRAEAEIQDDDRIMVPPAAAAALRIKPRAHVEALALP